MKIRSNIITRENVMAAFVAARAENQADIWVEDIREFRPRGYAHGVEVWAESNYGKRATGRNQTGYNRGSEPRAASWTDYGYVVAHLFNLDPHAQVGFYDNEADFVAKVRSYQPRGASLDFLNVLTSIGEYTDGCCADCTSGVKS